MVHASHATNQSAGSKHKLLAAIIFIATVSAGCSASVTRFDSPFYGFGSDDAPRAAAPARDPLPPHGIYDRQSTAPTHDKSAYAAPNANRVERDKLPSIGREPLYESVSPGVAHRRPQPIEPFDSQDRSASIGLREQSRTIVVQPGDTMYGLARRHGTTTTAMSAANPSSGPVLKPGQILNLPKGAPTKIASVSKPPLVNVAAAPAIDKAEVRGSANTKSWTGTHIVRSGDSLYTIARSNGVTVADLRSANDITDPRRLKPGMVLKIPGKKPSLADEPSVKITDVPKHESTKTGSAGRVPMQKEIGTGSIASPKVLNSAGDEPGGGEAPTNISAVTGDEPVQKPNKARNEKMRWPVVGRVIAPFGKRKDGTSNDGIDIAIPPGTDVRAAEEGIVAYSGSEVKGFGNLLLVRHEDGKVTAYAHNDKLLVQRGDRVRRGQVIAKSGNSGGADQPLLHFEVRDGSKPVDPMRYLETL